MGLLDRILSFFGRSDSSGDERTSDASVTVEREPRAAADAASEAAVKEPVPDEARTPDAESGTSAAESGRETTAEGDTGADEAAERETASEPEVEPVAEAEPEAKAGTEPERATETESEAGTEPEAESGTETRPAAESDSGAKAGAEAEGESEAEPEAETTDLQQVKGIGPAYASRLEEAGIDSAEALAEADPKSVAERIGVSAKQTEQWVARAKDL